MALAWDAELAPPWLATIQVLVSNRKRESESTLELESPVPLEHWLEHGFDSWSEPVACRMDETTRLSMEYWFEQC